MFIDSDAAIQKIAIRIINQYRNDAKPDNGINGADAFVIALAASQASQWIDVTGEKPGSLENPKIPFVCSRENPKAETADVVYHCTHIWYVSTSLSARAFTVSELQLHLWTMDFGKRLAALRKERRLTQQALADAIGCHVTMIRRYEAGETQPTLDVIRNMAYSLSVSADKLVFEHDERDPVEELRMQFEAISQLPPEERSVVTEVLDSLIIKYQTRRWDTARQATATRKPSKSRATAA